MNAEVDNFMINRTLISHERTLSNPPSASSIYEYARGFSAQKWQAGSLGSPICCIGL